MLIKVRSALNNGLDTIEIDVEVNFNNKGLPGFDIVGLAGKAVSESKQRVRAALVNCGFEFPAAKIMVNLAPGDVPKDGAFYDLPIAAAVISHMTGHKIPRNALFYGELSLNGDTRHTKGTLLLSLFAKEKKIKHIFIPRESANEAAIVAGVKVYPVDSLTCLCAHLSGDMLIEPTEYIEEDENTVSENEFDMSEVLGQEQAKRAVEIAAAGGHNFLMVGSPGSGKTMLARAIPGILPQMREKESLEVTKIYSASGRIPPGGSIIRTRPFRSPHHTISAVGLIGGGAKPQPGEISLAHRGVLFLDEFNEFPRSVIEAMRQPMEDGRLTISRSQDRATYPSRFMLIASANPCNCGFLYDPKKQCTCTEREIERYKKRVSGPIIDRIDLHVDVPVVEIEKFAMDFRNSKTGKPQINSKNENIKSETSEQIRERVQSAREIQSERFANDTIFTNAEMKNKHIKKYCKLSKEVEDLLQKAAKAMNLSGRSYFKMIKIARTIADIAGAEEIELNHMAEALQYRPKM